MERVPASGRLVGPGPSCQWRNLGRRLGVLPTPDIEAEPLRYLQTGAIFDVARVAAIGSRRYLQLADCGNWVPECSRKDSSRVVVEVLEPPTEANSSLGADITPFPHSPVRVRYLRIIVMSTRSENPASTQIAQISFRRSGALLSLEGFAAENSQGESPQREGPERVLANKGKWLDLRFKEHGRSILFVTAPTTFEVDDFAFRTASDAPTRDPVSFRVDGSCDGWEWMVLHDMTADSSLYIPAARSTWTPWFQLRPSIANLHDAEADMQICDQQQPQPGEMSWWRNFGERLAVLKPRHHRGKNTDFLQPGVFFPALRMKSYQGRHFLELPDNRGWVPECCSKDASTKIVKRVENQEVPAAVEKLMEQASLGKRKHVADEGQLAAKRIRVHNGDTVEHVSDEDCVLKLLSNSSSITADGTCGNQMRDAPLVKQLRILVLAARSPNVVSTQIAQVCLRENGKLINLSGFTAENPRGQSPTGEGPEKVLGPVGKWLDTNFSSNKQSELILIAPHTIAVNDLAFCTCRDMEARDPIKFRIDGSKDGQNWFLLHETGDDFPTPANRRTWTPWLLLEAKGSSPVVWTSDSLPICVMRHRCPIAACSDIVASTDGYLVKGMLLRHMMRKHPNAKETDDLKIEMGKHASVSRRTKCGSFARRALVHAAPSACDLKNTRTKSLKKRKKSLKSRRRKFDNDSAPSTPERYIPGEVITSDDKATGKMDVRLPSHRHGATGKKDPFTPLRPSPPRVASKTLSDVVDLKTRVRLSAIAGIPVGSRIDVEATVETVSLVKRKLLLRRRGEFVTMRRFLIRDGKTTCWWVLLGKLADMFDEKMCGLRIEIRGAKVHLFNNKRHISGCTDVRACAPLT